MDNGVVTLSYSWPVQETNISQQEEQDFSLEIGFYTSKKTRHQHWRMG